MRVNPEFTRLFGYSEQEALGKRIKDLITPDDLQVEVESHMYRMVQTEEVFAVETVRRHKNGTRVPVSLICVPVAASNGRRDTGHAICRVITGTKRLRMELKQERDRLRLVRVMSSSFARQLPAGSAGGLNALEAAA